MTKLDFRGNLIRCGGDAKTIKGNGAEYATAILYMTPHKLTPSAPNLCPNAEIAGCLAGCLNTAGRGAMHSVQSGRERKAIWYATDRAGFMAQLHKDISRFERYCAKRNVKPAVRLNGTTDIRYELIKHEGKTIFEHFPNVAFYDYTKIANRPLNIPNYDLTFSYSAASPKYIEQVQKAIDRNMRLAVVFRDRDQIPPYFMGAPVLDGDKNDLRFTEPQGAVVALYAKGKAKRDQSGFVVDAAPSMIERVAA